MSSPFKRQFKANLNTFTDRISFKKILKEAVETPQQYDEHRIKVIYGHGGQGKTYLKRDFFVNEYLKQKSVEDQNLIYCDTIDFEHASMTRYPENGLLCIAKELIEQGGMSLPAFTLAFLKLKQLNSLTSNLEQQYPYLYKITSHKVNKENIVDEVLSEIIDFAVGSGLSEMAGSIPLVGFFAKRLVSKGKNKVLDWLRESGAGDILEGLDDMDRFQLLEKLPMFLGWDVYNSFINSSAKGIPNKRIVIIIDGYETLWSDGKNQDIGKDLWVRKLAEYMTGVLIVIFGREALRWHEIEKNPDLINGLEHIHIDGFKDEDANGYLSQVPIENEAIRAAIIRNSKGSDRDGKCSPLYLQLEAKTYENIINSGKVPVPGDFIQGNDKTENEIFDRLIKHMDPSVSNALGALSLSNYIDNDIIALMEQAQAFATASVSMKSLREYSFIIDAKDRLLVHGFVREAAAVKYKDVHFPRFLRVHEALFTYFDEKLHFDGFKQLTFEIEATIEHAAYHKKEFDQVGFPSWLVSKARIFYGASLQQDDVLTKLLHSAVDILEPSDKLAFESYDTDLNRTIGQLFYHLANRYDTAVNRKASKNHIDLSRAAFETVYTQDMLEALKTRFDLDDIQQADFDLLDSYIDVLAKSAEIYVSLQLNIQADEFFIKVFHLCDDFKIYHDQNDYMNYLTSVGRFSEAEAYFFNKHKTKSAELAELHDKSTTDKDAYQSTLLSLSNSANDLARVLKMQGRYEEAKKYNEIALKLMVGHFGPDHLYTAYAKHNLASTYVREGKNQEFTLNLLDEIRVIYEDNFSKNHLYYGYLLADYFEVNKYEKNDENAEYFKDAMRIFSNESLTSREAVENLLNGYDMLTNAINNDGEFGTDAEDVIKFFENGISDMFYNRFEDMKNLFSAFHPTIHKGLRITADILQKRGDSDKSNEIMLKAFEFERLMNFILTIRAVDEGTHILSDETKIKALALFKTIMSLPADYNAVTIEVSKLPFYKTIDLYKISFAGTQIPVTRFVLSDMNEAWLIDHTNAPIFDIGERDMSLHVQHAKAYAMFFFDTTIGRHGRFFLLANGNDIPWQVDSKVSESFKATVASLIPELCVVHEDDESICLQGAILFKDYVFLNKIVILKSDGRIRLENGTQVVFYETESGQLGIIEEDNLPLDKFSTFQSIPASVDPIYKSVESKESPDNFYSRVMRVCDMIDLDLLYLHPLVDRNEDELAQYISFQESYSIFKKELADDQKMVLQNFKSLVMYNYNINEFVYDNYIKLYQASDQYAEDILHKLHVMHAAINETEEYINGKHPEQEVKEPS